MKVSDDVQGVLQAAYLHAKELGHEYLTPEHILHAATHFELARQILSACGADPEEMKKELDHHLQKKMPAVKKAEPSQSLGFQSVIARALFHTEAASKEIVTSGTSWCPCSTSLRASPPST